MARRIFINYRRDDARGSAALLYEHLSRAFGVSNVFMDVDNVMPGQRFDQQFQRALAASEFFIAVIGPRWLDVLKAKQASGERDYVHDEIAVALKHRVVVIPVMAEGAKLPQEKDLPPKIKMLATRQPHIISQERRQRDIEDLTRAIGAAPHASYLETLTL